MGVFILLLGLIQMAGAVLVAITAKSAVHEILSAVAFGLGVVSMAFAVIIGKLDDMKASKG
ncbi:MAG: hypothetical protein ACREEJ_12595 [Ensifer adhaerens]